MQIVLILGAGIICGALHIAIPYAPSSEAALWLARFSAFFGVWFCFGLFDFATAFGKRKMLLSARHSLVLLFAIGITSVLALTPFVFEHNLTAPPSEIDNGLLAPVFYGVIILLILAALYRFIQMMRIQSKGEWPRSTDAYARPAPMQSNEPPKSDFRPISMTESDLRPPITAIQKLSALLLDGAYGKITPAVQEALRQIADSASEAEASLDAYLRASETARVSAKPDKSISSIKKLKIG